MKTRPAIISVSFIFIMGCNMVFSPNPPLLTLDYEHLQEIKNGISEKSPLYQAAYQRLCREADDALNHRDYSVIQKDKVPPSGDKRDYMSQAPYWWPDPMQPGGLPYIRKDGIHNPEVYTSNFDKASLMSFTEDVNTLTLAWFFSGEKEYAEKAAQMIKTWFLDPETGMNPNLRYAQSIPGITDGRGIGIIDTRRFIQIIDAVHLLELGPAWKRTDTRKLRKWFSEYLSWLENSANGKEEQGKENNHGTWYDVQTAGFALFTGNGERAREIINNAKKIRINNQIDSNGMQEQELVRTNAYGYSVFNLEALITLGRIGDLVGIDLWDYQLPAEGNIKVACDYVFSFIDRMDKWPYQQIAQVNWTNLIPIVVEAKRKYEDPAYQAYLHCLEEKVTTTDRMVLTKL